MRLKDIFNKKNKPESFSRAELNERVCAARKEALATADQSDLEKALKKKIELSLDAVDYIIFQADGKHIAKFHEGIIKMGCEKKTPQEWIDTHDKRATEYNYSDDTRQKYILFFKMCLKTQELELAVEEFRAKKLAELREITQSAQGEVEKEVTE